MYTLVNGTQDPVHRKAQSVFCVVVVMAGCSDLIRRHDGLVERSRGGGLPAKSHLERESQYPSGFRECFD
jgi:hypothetical protein